MLKPSERRMVVGAMAGCAFSIALGLWLNCSPRPEPPQPLSCAERNGHAAAKRLLMRELKLKEDNDYSFRKLNVLATSDNLVLVGGFIELRMRCAAIELTDCERMEGRVRFVRDCQVPPDRADLANLKALGGFPPPY